MVYILQLTVALINCELYQIFLPEFVENAESRCFTLDLFQSVLILNIADLKSRFFKIQKPDTYWGN